MFLRFFLMFYVLFFPVFTHAHDWKGNEVDYGGLTIYCKWGCGDAGDPYMQDIWAILNPTICEVLGKKENDLLDQWMNKHSVIPWIVADDFEYDVYDWQSAKGLWIDRRYESLSCWSHSSFLELAACLHSDLHFYYLTAPVRIKDFNVKLLKKLQAGFKEGYECFRLFDGEPNFEYMRSFGGGCSGSDLKSAIAKIKKENKLFEEDGFKRVENYQRSLNLVESATQQIDVLYKNIFIWCLKHHQEEGIQFTTALENLLLGDYEEAFNQISFLIDQAEKRNLGDDLVSKLYLLKGQVQSEFCLYADAILTLTTSIQKNPQLKESYFERASAYFELGEFDKAIEDYLISRHQISSNEAWKTSAKLSAGMVAGIMDGGVHALVNFIPNTLGTLRGLSNGLWAFAQHPIDASNAFADAAFEYIQWIKSRAPLDLFQDIVPEMKEFIQKYDQLEDFERGVYIGQMIGKYGIDILLWKQTALTVKAYNNLSNVNKTMTLDALASSKTNSIILEEAAKRWAQREAVLKNGTLKVDWGKQGKHVIGHNSYMAERNKSIWEYPMEKTQELINSFAGTGIKSHKSGTGIPGTAGYQEIVNFEEFIGYVVDRNTGVKTATCWGKIHYSKDGVHVVPHLPGDRNGL